jgi:hypothetical protein
MIFQGFVARPQRSHRSHLAPRDATSSRGGRRLRFARCVALLLLAIAPLGCGGSGPETYPVSGTVTFDGQPVPDGDILFVPADGKGLPDPGKIENGEFSFDAKPGPKRVEIEASRQTGPVDTSMGMAPRQPYIPACYNTETTLTAEVTPDGPNEFDFPLKSQPGQPPPGG